MRPPHFTLSLPILLLPLFTAALPQDPAPLPSSEATTTSTSTSTLTVTRTLIRGTSVVIATLPELPISDGAQATAISSILPDVAAPTVSPVASDILIAAPYPSSGSGASSNATGTGAGKPVFSTTGPAPALFTGGAATTGVGGNAVGLIAMAMVGGWLATGGWL